MKDIELPPLPEPDICRYVVTVWRDGVECEIDNGPRYTVEQMQAYARAIESAATAPLLARIAELEAANEAFGKRQEWWNARMLELEQQLAEARKDAMHEAASICDALPAPPSCNVLERSLWDVATVAAADAIRAAIKEQTK